MVRFDCGATGMVVFRIKGENDLTERLLKRLNHRGNIHCVPASLKGKYVIRYGRFFASYFSSWWHTFVFSIIFLPFLNVLIAFSFTVTSTHTSNDDLLKDWAEIRKVSTELLEELNVHITDHRARVHLKGSNPCFDLNLKKKAFYVPSIPFVKCMLLLICTKQNHT